MPDVRPLIGVSTSELREARTVRPLAQGEPRQHEIALGLDYPESVDASGGLPALNVAREGTLHQHLPDVVGTDIDHRQAVAGSRPTHWISLQQGSGLATTLGRGRSKVNSFHHQGIQRLGTGLTEVAWAADGTIEGVEDPSRPFLVGVQWHAESLAHRPEHRALFAASVAASNRYARRARPFAS